MIKERLQFGSGSLIFSLYAFMIQFDNEMKQLGSSEFEPSTISPGQDAKRTDTSSLSVTTTLGTFPCALPGSVALESPQQYFNDPCEFTREGQGLSFNLHSLKMPMIYATERIVMNERISIRKLQAMLADPSLTESELRPYVIEDEALSRAFAPALRFNPQTVDNEGLEADVLLSAFNSFSRRSRQRRYRKKLRNGWSGLKIVSEGDSWWQYPILLDDVIDQLFPDYAIYSLGAAGDLLQDIVDENELAHAIETENPDVFLISGGGNDMVGGGRLSTLVHRFDPTLSADQYPTNDFETFLAQMVDLYTGLFSRLTQAHPSLKIVTHGYDHSIPNRGRWLGRPLERNGITDRDLQRDIMRVIIDRYNDSMLELERQFPGRVFHTDCRGSVSDKQWHDELHPTEEGFRAASARFRQTIERATEGGVKNNERHLVAVAQRPNVDDRPDLDRIQRMAAERFARSQAKREAVSTGFGVRDSASRIAVRRRLLPAQDELALERVLGRNNLFHLNYFEQALRAARSVCKIHVRDFSNSPQWVGTGFLVGERMLLTNNHVLPSSAFGGVAEFDYEYNVDYLPKPTTQFELDPARLFITDEELDFTLVGVKSVATNGEELNVFGALRVIADSGKALVGEPVSIIQHPRGDLKQVALRDSRILAVPDAPDDDFLHYTSDTERGSSGSPVFNDQWQVVALHHASVPDGHGGWIANEGVRMSRILQALELRQAEKSGGEGGAAVAMLRTA